MKFKSFYAFMASAAMLVLAASCDKESKEPETEPEKPVEKSKECKLLSFNLQSGDYKVEGFVYDEDHVAEITYMPGDRSFLTNATAEVTLSDKATISPDPAEAKDYTVEGGVKYTVTAEDGKTSQVYSVVLREAKIKVTCKRGMEEILW